MFGGWSPSSVFRFSGFLHAFSFPSAFCPLAGRRFALVVADIFFHFREAQIPLAGALRLNKKTHACRRMHERNVYVSHGGLVLSTLGNDV